ncbi:MAG TPA: NADH-quinone oxidoreductase subunit C [Bacteroidales bacterium]|jgi:NADH-quinone oxidoreductase subunit C|nr:NADH-quinone oxidoreductase subunit C [Bacteroidales bacterium]MDD4235628.1 NADH-quinone oxidoreductase subunit C [Bacteroidales bacterium]HRW21778.1 NADH-quinone oxidoreductase subunit C [Bacteroidales bacterium]HXK81239.1 NADH-quinone oxidoreductase subunit C [Bacteroidales bacterium]
MKEILEKVKRVFPLQNIKKQRENLYFVETEKIHLVSLITNLRDINGFKHLVLLTAVDRIENGVFQLTYLLNNDELKIDLGVRVFLDRENAEMESIHHLWKQAATYQRELREMFGINFSGSPRVDKAFILEGWDGMPPYRRDFDTLKYSEETYFPRPGRSTNDPAEYMKQKMYPDE